MKVALGTRKGVIVLKKGSQDWKIENVSFDGVKVSYVKKNPFNGDLWAGVNHGHWGPKLHVSKDEGKTFSEVTLPRFPEKTKETLKDFWAIEFTKDGKIFLGVEPAALFMSHDQGKTWEFNDAFFQLEGRDQWFSGGTDGTCLHSILLHPKNPSEIGVAISCAGYIASHDGGKSWEYSCKGMKANFLPDPDSPIGQDPHKVVRSPSHPDTLWMQNHCGIYKSTDNGKTWQDLSKAEGLLSFFGWDVAVDEKDSQIAYTVPAKSDETRVPVNYALAIQKTTDGGKTWTVHRQGLPQEGCYDICYRHALDLKGENLIFGTTTGNLYFSQDGAKSFTQISMHLPPIYSAKWI